MQQALYPIAFPRQPSVRNGARLLALDVGGTKVDLALYEVAGKALVPLKEVRVASEKYGSLTEVLARFIGKSAAPRSLSIAFAGPVQAGKAQATNLGWEVDAMQLGQTLGIPRVYLLNDLEAEAFGLAGLEKADLHTVHPGAVGMAGNAAIIAPGTGLGEAGLFWDGAALHPFASEGGHADFAPRDAFDWELLQYLQRQYGHVSWERLLSGPGIEHVFNFLLNAKKWDMPGSIRFNAKDPARAEAISRGAESDCPVCVETLRRFVRYLAIEASNLALKFKATGGIFIGGGIAPKIWNEHLQQVFLDHFFEVGRMKPLLESVPVQLILNPNVARLGAALYACGGALSVTRSVSVQKPVREPGARPRSLKIAVPG